MVKLTFENCRSKLTNTTQVRSVDITKARKLFITNKNIDEIASFAKFKGLECIDLSNNNLKFVRQLKGLLAAPKLVHLVLTGNPITQTQNYREDVKKLWESRPNQLVSLDGILIDLNGQLYSDIVEEEPPKENEEEQEEQEEENDNPEKSTISADGHDFEEPQSIEPPTQTANEEENVVSTAPEVIKAIEENERENVDTPASDFVKPVVKDSPMKYEPLPTPDSKVWLDTDCAELDIPSAQDRWEIKKLQLPVCVIGAERVGGIKPYIRFTVEPKTGVKSCPIHVVRRYNQFKSLRAHLIKTYVDIVVPNIPQKSFNYFTSRFEPNFLEYRKEGLEIFLNKCFSHEIICQDNILKMFVELDEFDLESIKKAASQPPPTQPLSDESEEQKPLKRTGSFMDKMKRLSSKTVYVKEKEEWTTEYRKNQHHTQKTHSKIFYHGRDIAVGYMELSVLIMNLKSVMGDFGRTEQDHQARLFLSDPDDYLKTINSVREHIDVLSRAYDNSGTHFSLQFNSIIEYWIRNVRSVEEMLAARDELIFDTEQGDAAIVTYDFSDASTYNKGNYTPTKDVTTRTEACKKSIEITQKERDADLRKAIEALIKCEKVAAEGRLKVWESINDNIPLIEDIIDEPTGLK